MKTLTLIILFLLSTFCYSQKDITKTLLAKKYPNKESFSTDKGVWVYNDDELMEFNLSSFSTLFPHLKFYTCQLTNFLGYHVLDVECIVVFDENQNSVTLIPPFWYSGIDPAFTKLFIGLNLEQTDKNQFFADFQKAFSIGSTEIISNSKIEKNFLSFDLIRNPENGPYRNIKLVLNNSIISRLQDK